MMCGSFASQAGLLCGCTRYRKMKNAEKLAASKKQPKYPVYEEGGRIVWIRPGGLMSHRVLNKAIWAC